VLAAVCNPSSSSAVAGA